MIIWNKINDEFLMQNLRDVAYFAIDNLCDARFFVAESICKDITFCRIFRMPDYKNKDDIIDSCLLRN